jgi:hypothetical protein
MREENTLNPRMRLRERKVVVAMMGERNTAL